MELEECPCLGNSDSLEVTFFAAGDLLSPEHPKPLNAKEENLVIKSAFKQMKSSSISALN
jgi:hypothetical protein